MAERPLVAICAGKDCRRRGEFAEIRGSLARRCDVVELSCIGICSGPVVVADPVSPRPQIYAKLRTKRARRLVVALASGDRDARRSLADRRTKKSKAVVRVERQMKRRAASVRRAA